MFVALRAAYDELRMAPQVPATGTGKANLRMAHFAVLDTSRAPSLVVDVAFGARHDEVLRSNEGAPSRSDRPCRESRCSSIPTRGPNSWP
jgi:hypothetical protein